jgi:hypothetical protein
MANTKRFLLWILVEDTTIIILFPPFGVHGIIAHQLELAETVITVVGAGGAVDDELLTCGWVDELFWAFVGRKSVVDGTIVGCSFPSVGGR